MSNTCKDCRFMRSDELGVCKCNNERTYYNIVMKDLPACNLFEDKNTTAITKNCWHCKYCKLSFSGRVICTNDNSGVWQIYSPEYDVCQYFDHDNKVDDNE